MADREIIEIIRHERSTELRIICGHYRSIGGHVFSNGKPTSQLKVGDFYECHDGHCGGRR